MNNFVYSKAHTLSEALEAIDKNAGARFIAGGTNILDLMKENVMKPTELIDINSIGLSDIERTTMGGVLIGALATNSDTAYHSLIRSEYPLLSDAILAGASPQLRNMATNGGNLLQRTRCYYFYDTAAPCNKRSPGSGCSAISGFNRIHAILGTSEQCIATHPSDMCVALAALDAKVHVAGKEGTRLISFPDFHKLPGDTPHIDNTLSRNEMITGIELPASAFNIHYKYLKVRDRASYAFALVSAAVAFELKDGTIKDARIALGGVSHKPWRNRQAEEMLIGQDTANLDLKGAIAHLLEGARGFGENDFKIGLARRVIARACREALRKEADHAV